MSEPLPDIDYSVENPWTPPTPRRAAARALVMSAVVCRGAIEGDVDEPEAEALRVRVLDWLGRVGVTDEAEPHELTMLNSPLGILTVGQVMAAGWRAEGLAVLAWALQRFPLPPHDEEVSSQDVAEALDFLWDDAADILKAPTLRRQAEIEWLGDQLYDVNTRLRQFRRWGVRNDFAAFVSNGGSTASTLRYIRLAGNDLAIGGLPISKAAPEDIVPVVRISNERHQAANWLLGQEELYSKVTPDT